MKVRCPGSIVMSYLLETEGRSFFFNFKEKNEHSNSFARIWCFTSMFIFHWALQEQHDILGKQRQNFLYYFLFWTTFLLLTEREYCLRFTMHKRNCFILGGFWSSKIVVSSAASAVLTFFIWRAILGCGEGAIALALYASSWRNRDRRHFLCFAIQHSGKRGGIVDRFVKNEYFTLRWSTQIKCSVEGRNDRNEHHVL